VPEYLAPGVYIEELRNGPRPIEGVRTSTAGFAGQTERGPTNPTLVTSWLDFCRWFGGYIDHPPQTFQNVFLPYAVRGFFDNGGLRLFVARVVGGDSLKAKAVLGNNCEVEAIGEGEWGNNIIIAVKTASANADWFRIQIAYYAGGVPQGFVDPTDPTQLANPDRKDPDVFEDYDNLSAVSTDENFALLVINASSRLVKVLTCSLRPENVEFPQVQLQRGVTTAATLNDYLDESLGDPEQRKGLAGLAAIREISVVAVPDEVVIEGLRGKVIESCEAARDRFAVISVDENIANVADLQAPIDTSYAAFYYPWVRVPAPHTPAGHRTVPSNGHVAGIYARVDLDRGVHKAPANEVVRGILTDDPDQKPLEFTVGQREQDILNPRGVNVIRDFRSAGRDVRVFGARTMSSDPMWKYINIRRLFIYVEHSIDQGTQWVVFEPNQQQTWSLIRTQISAFLRTVWLNGALTGATQEQAFFVKCDRTTMTQDDIDNGRLTCLIGIAPIKPAEFVIFRISQKTVEDQS
jgi:hypothetical protein